MLLVTASYPHSPCGFDRDCQSVFLTPDSCPSPAYFHVLDEDIETGEIYPIGMVCHGHANSKALANFDKVPLPEMWATQCHSGDTWLSCDKHKSMYDMFSSRAPKKVRSDRSCEGCLVEEEVQS